MRRGATIGAVSVVLPFVVFGAARGDDAAPPTQPDAKKEAERLGAQTDDSSNPYVLPNEIVVTAASGGVPLTYPHERDVIDHQTLQTYPQGSIVEALRQIPGVFVQSDAGNDVKMSIGLRGQQARVSSFTAVLVDGIPVKQTLYGVIDLDIFPFTFERAWKIDVVEGGADLRYGPNAYGGVINFITEPIPDKPTALFRGAFGSDDEYSALTEVGGTWDKFGVLVTTVKKGGDGWRDDSEYRQEDSSAKFRYRFDDADELTWSVNRYLEDENFASGITQAQLEQDPRQSRAEHDFGRGDVDRYNAQFLHTFSRDAAFELIAWYHQSFREFSLARPTLPPFTTQNHQPAEYHHYGVEARMSWATDVFGLKNSFYHSLRSYGDRANRLNYTEPYSEEGAGPHTIVTNADFTTQSFALFDEDTISLTDSLDLTVGARDEHIAMTVDNLVSHAQANADYSVNLPEASLTWRVLPKSAVFASYSEGFGTPLYTTMDPSSSSYNPNLKPENATNKELGVRTREIPWLEASATAFRQDYDHKIQLANNPSGIAQYFNAQSAHVVGVEIAASCDLGKVDERLTGVSVYANCTRQDSVIDHGSSAPGSGDDLAGNLAPNAPRVLVNAGAAYRHKSGLWARVGVNHTGGYFSDAANSDPPSADAVNGFVPAFTIWDAAVGWNERADGTGFSASIGCTNVFDDTSWFRRNTTGIQPGAPRRFNVNVGYAVAF